MTPSDNKYSESDIQDFELQLRLLQPRKVQFSLQDVFRDNPAEPALLLPGDKSLERTPKTRRASNHSRLSWAGTIAASWAIGLVAGISGTYVSLSSSDSRSSITQKSDVFKAKAAEDEGASSSSVLIANTKRENQNQGDLKADTTGSLKNFLWQNMLGTKIDREVTSHKLMFPDLISASQHGEKIVPIEYRSEVPLKRFEAPRPPSRKSQLESLLPWFQSIGST